MNWYSGSISDAVVEAKSHNKVFLVYIEGDDDLSKQMTATYNNPVVTEKLSSQNCVALKLSANSLSHQQFSEIYPVLVVPSSFFIGRYGIPLEILTGSLEAKDLCAKLDKVFELHSEECKPVSSSQSNSPQSENASPAATASSLSEGSSLAAAPPVASKDPAVDNKVHSDQESKNSPVGASAASESTIVASSASNTAAPVESSPSVVSVEDVGQSPSTSQENSASSSSEALPPLEDRVERAKALLEERRILKEMEENEKEKKEELERRKVGKAVQQAQHNRQEAELKEWALNRAKEKEEERVARERVRAQIAQDRAERAAKFQQEKARELETLKEKENAALRAEQEKGDRDAALRSTVAHLQFRLPNGSSVTHQFSADCTLEDARQFVLQEVRPSCGYFTLCTTFPRRHFSENNYAETLRDLQLAPTATLLILPASATIPREGGFLNFLLWTLLTPFLVVWRMITSWFRGSTTVGHGSPAAAAAAATADGTDKEQVKTEKPQAKPAGKAASTKKDPSGFSNVSASYSQLQSGLQDIVKSYVASKSSTTNKGASTSNAKAEEAKKQPDETNGKRRKANDDSDMYGGEEERNFFDEFLDRTKSDFYCKVCDSHMNSEQMWENHVQGKRHLKNIKKDPGEPPSKVKAVKTDLTPKILRTLDQVREPVVGLSYMCELQRAESYLDPTYSCFLCHATCTVSSVVDHILGTKHRLAYLKAANPDEYSLVEEMKLKKSGLTSIAEDYAREFERKTGRGNMEVKIEKPKMAPPSSKRDRRYIEDESDDDDFSFRRRHISPPPVELGWRRDRDRWSPPQVTSMLSPQQMTLRLSSMLASTANYSVMPMMEKLNVLQQVSNNLVVVSESEGREVMKIINALTQSLLQYKIRVLPPQLQDTLARHIISGDTKALENTLGMAGSGMSNVGSVISSMAASGDLPLRNAHSIIAPALRMLPGPLGGPSNSSESGRNMWGPSGPGVARMPSPMRGGYNSGSYPPSSQWPSGMGGSSFRGSDRSSFGY